MAKRAQYQIQTKLPTTEIATIFRDRIQSRPSGFFGFTWSRKVAWRFSTPPEEDNPFAEIDNSDKPAFRVLAHHSLAKRPILANDAQVATWDGFISLDIWDKDSYRLVLITCQPGPAPKAHVGLVLEQLKTKDSTAEVNAGRA